MSALFPELPAADPGTPDTRSPARYLLWLARHQRTLLTLNALCGVGWMVSQALLWAAVGGAIDHGVTHHNTEALFAWVGIVMALGLFQAVCGALRHQFAVTNWLTATFRTIQVIGQRVAGNGSALAEEVTSGDVVNTVAADAMRIGGAFDVLARFAGSIASWLVVSIILMSTSLQLGLVVLLGVPILATLTTPLMRPLHRAQAAQRDAAGRLAALGADTVAGLRVLRGVGGEEVFLENYRRQSQIVRRAGVRIAGPQAGLESGQVLLPAILTAIVTFLGAEDVQRGVLQPGQLVAFFGYATFLTTPLRTAVEYVISTTRAYVGAGRVLRVLDVAPLVRDAVDPLPWPDGPVTLRDPVSGVELRDGVFAALVTETPAEATSIADRLGRYVGEGDATTVNGVALARVALNDTRRHVIVSEVEPRLFSGDLRDELAPHGDVSDDQILGALASSSALDVLDALEEGLDSHVEERGRSFSGGQRQRLSLARALLSDAQILILIEPTSAVDTHTEARIAQRLRASRAGRATLIATTSPLLLESVDEVILVVNGVVIDRGRHDDLVARSAVYRQIVLREEG
ncbi:MAG TPA: ABC transporter ATP-binding protein [Acidimicrobiales bacterium]|jgi:ABC-type multidrug transport system fused ATPase/permease subunit